MDDPSPLIPRSALASLAHVTHPKPGRRRFGVPPGGPWDREAFLIATQALGVDSATEVSSTRQGPWGAWTASASVAFCAAGLGGWVEGPWGRVRTPCVGWLDEGQSLELGSESAPRILLACCANPASQPHPGSWAARLDWSLEAPIALPFFGAKGQEIGGQITPQISRMGMVLTGAPINSPSLQKSEPSIAGAIQITPGGSFLIHGPEGPTLGGYPKVGCLGPWALSCLSRAPVGSVVNLLGDWEAAKEWEAQAEARAQDRLSQLRLTQKLGILGFPSAAR
jgi:allophanate hydrolase subunit 2